MFRQCWGMEEHVTCFATWRSTSHLKSLTLVNWFILSFFYLMNYVKKVSTFLLWKPFTGSIRNNKLKTIYFWQQLCVCLIIYCEHPLLVELITHSSRTNSTVYEYSPLECLPIYAFFCLDLCHVYSSLAIEMFMCLSSHFNTFVMFLFYFLHTCMKNYNL